MTRASAATAEVRKLAHVLDVAPDELDAVSGLAAADLKQLRRQVSDALFEADREAFVRVAVLAKALPVAVAAKVTAAVLPPLIAARTAELLDPDRAAELAGRLPAAYLAEVALRMDAARSPHIVAAVPPARVADVARELARRGEWVVIGGFVAEVTSLALAASVAELDGEQLLRVGFVLEDPGRLDEIVDLLTDRQLDAMLAAAAGSGLWTELAEIVRHLSAPQRARLAERFAAAPEPVRGDAESAAGRGELDGATLAVLGG
jgi:hypothetical protein